MGPSERNTESGANMTKKQYLHYVEADVNTIEAFTRQFMGNFLITIRIL